MPARPKILCVLGWHRLAPVAAYEHRLPGGALRLSISFLQCRCCGVRRACSEEWSGTFLRANRLIEDWTGGGVLPADASFSSASRKAARQA